MVEETGDVTWTLRAARRDRMRVGHDRDTWVPLTPRGVPELPVLATLRA
jgi:hypothetical protein